MSNSAGSDIDTDTNADGRRHVVYTSRSGRGFSSDQEGRTSDHPRQPTEVTDGVGFFDRFAGRAADATSRAPFFAFCVLLIVVWAPSYFLLGSLDTWQLIINTATTIITFLLVALLQNSQKRNDMATQHKLNAIADALADLMDQVGRTDSEMQQDIKELKRGVGLEDRESTG